MNLKVKKEVQLTVFFVALFCGGLRFAPADETVGLSLNLDLNVERIEFLQLEFLPEVIVTNVSSSWVAVEQITTNGMFSNPPSDIVTNSVQTQIEIINITTNAAHWSVPFVYTIPAGAPLQIGTALSATPQRAAMLDVDLVLTPAQLAAIIGPEFAAKTQIAAETFGALPVQGNLEAALQSAVLATLATAEN